MLNTIVVAFTPRTARDGERGANSIGEGRGVMGLRGELKEKVEMLENIGEAGQAIEGVGVELGDKELDGVAGGMRSGYDDPYCRAECPRCGKFVSLKELPRHMDLFHKK